MGSLHHHGGTESLAELNVTRHGAAIVIHPVSRPLLMGCNFETSFAVQVVGPVHVYSLGGVLKQICCVQAQSVRCPR